MSSFSVILMAVGAFACGTGVFLWCRSVSRKKLLGQLRLRLLLVKLPEENGEGREVRKEIARMDQFIAALGAFRGPVVFEAAVPHVGEEIHFYVAVDAGVSDALMRQIQSFWSAAEVEPVEDYNIFNSTGAAVYAFLKEKERFMLPIRTYEDFEGDSFSAILGGFSKMEAVGEGGAVQLVLYPADKTHRKALRSALSVLKKGGSLKDALRGFGVSFGDITETLSPSSKKEEGEKRVDEGAMKALERKSAKPLFKVNLRVVTSATTEERARSILEGVTAGFSQFSAPSGNEFEVAFPRSLREAFHRFSFRRFAEDEMMVLTSEELASIFHFPNAFTAIPKVKFLKAREAPPPENLPEEGVGIGESVFRGQRKMVNISDEDRRRHVYLIGQTGTGKSNLLTTMAAQDIRRGKGVAVIDPHGDFIEDLLSLVPKEREKKVIVFDPSDLERPVGLNMLEYDFAKPEQKTFVVNEMIGIFDKLYDLKATGGPMFEQYMRNALQLLMEDMPNEPATLTEVPRVFTDTAYRERKLQRITNPIVRDFWLKEAVKAGGEAALQNLTPYITSKFNVFLTNDYMRPIIGQEKSSFNFRTILDEGNIFLVNLAKGKLGDINANLLGMIVIGKFLMAAFSRVDIPQEARKDFNLYIDEFQNFTTDSIASILSEARKYRLNLVIGHQFIAQLTEKIRDAVFGNVGSLIVFRVGAQDAEFLEKQFAPVFSARDLMNIDNFNAYVKLLIQGQTSRPFNIRTLRAEKGERSRADALKLLSRLKYGKPREEIENEIRKRLSD